MNKTITVGASALIAISCMCGATSAYADPIPPFPYVVEDPFAHGRESIQQPNGSGDWVDVSWVCASKPLRLIAPETAEASETAFNHRLASGSSGVFPSSAASVGSASAEFPNAAALGWRSGNSYQFVYYADAARGSSVRLNFESGGVPFTVPYFAVTDFC